MANYVKRLRACLAPLLLIYTVSVTYFLAQTAWGNAPEEGVSNRKHPAVIDVLVQEERRHLRSFQDIVQSNRDSNPPSYVAGRTRRNLQVTNSSVMDQVLILDEMGTDGVREDADGVRGDADGVRHTGDVTVASVGGLIGKSDRNFEQNSDSQKQTFTDTKQTFKVEVEQWDHGEGHGGGHVVNKAAHRPAPSLPKWPAQQKVGPRHAEVKYSIEYCDGIFKDLGTTSNICERKLAMEGSDQHIPPSKTSLSFIVLGDVYIFSCFLDTRVTPPLVRFITIGVQGRDLTKSYYWCVFDVSVRGSNDTHTNTHTDTATQLEYWAASDGHKKPAQFYILSCPVPDLALPSFYSRHQGTIRVVIGDQHSPRLNPGQVGVTVPVVNNLAGSARPRGGNPSGNKREYFQKMEQDLQLLSNVIQADNNDDEDVSVDNKNNGDDNINNGNKFFFQTPNVEQPDGDVNNKNVNIFAEPEVENSESFSEISDYKIVACVAPLQGNIGVIQLIEFIELQLLLGNHHIVFYAFQSSEEISSILRMYERRGLATVLAWKVPSPGSIWANGRDVALNDCLYRTMHLFHYAIFLDIDEFFVPRATPDMPSFLRYLKAVHHFNASRISDLVFSSAYFPAPTKQEYKNVSLAPDFTKDVSRMATLKSVFRSYHNQQHTLRMLRGEKAFRVGPGERRKTSFNISPRYAAVHHYSFCPRVTADPGKTTQAGLNVSKTSNDNNVLTQNQNTGESRQQIPREDKAAVSGDLTKGHVLVTSSPASTAPVDMCLHKKVDWIMWRYKAKLIERTKESIRRLNKGSG